MRALIVVESSFGNTRAVAGAVAEGLGEVMAVDLRDIADAPATLEPGIDLLGGASSWGPRCPAPPARPAATLIRP